VITSPENPRVKEALRLRKGRERRRRGLFIAEGPREVERAISAGLAVREIFLAPELLPDWAPSSGLEEPRPQVVAAVVVSGAGRRADLRQAVECVRVRQPDARRPAESHSRADEGAA